MNKKVVSLILLLILIFLVSSIFFLKGKKTPPQTLQPLRIASEYWPGSYWVEVAYKKGFFTDAHLSVTLEDVTDNYNDSLKNMVDGKIDENDFTLYDLIKYNSEGADLRGVINSSVSSGVEALITTNAYDTVTSLRGKRIGIAKNTYLEYLLDQILKRYNMNIQDVTVIDIIPENAHDELKKHTVDAVLTYEPTVSEILQDKTYHKIFDTSQILGAVPGVIAFHQSFIDKYPSTVQAFVSVWNKTTDYMQQHPEETYQIIAEYYKDSEKATIQEAEDFTKIDKILNLQDNKVSFSYATGFDSLYEVSRLMNNYMLDRHIINEEVDSQIFLDPQFIRNL